MSPDEVLEQILAAWKHDTSWEGFGREVGTILATAGLAPGTLTKSE